MENTHFEIRVFIDSEISGSHMFVPRRRASLYRGTKSPTSAEDKVYWGVAPLSLCDYIATVATFPARVVLHSYLDSLFSINPGNNS